MLAGGRDERESAMEGPALVSCAFREESKDSCESNVGGVAVVADDEAGRDDAVPVRGAEGTAPADAEAGRWSTGIGSDMGAGASERHGVHERALVLIMTGEVGASVGRLPRATAEGYRSASVQLPIGHGPLYRTYSHDDVAYASADWPSQSSCCSRYHLAAFRLYGAKINMYQSRK